MVFDDTALEKAHRGFQSSSFAFFLFGRRSLMSTLPMSLLLSACEETNQKIKANVQSRAKQVDQLFALLLLQKVETGQI